MTGTQNAVQCNGDSASFRDVLHVLADDPAFRDQFNDWVASSSFDTFRWETPPVTSDLIDRPFEFVVIINPGLGERPDPSVFSKQFTRTPESSIHLFNNLGGDTLLVVPAPVANHHYYEHLGAFIRGAPHEQSNQLRKQVAEGMLLQMGTQPAWLNTASATFRSFPSH